ncbi:glycoside hydrolase family 3 N-terminal domain-containing protein [Demequina sp.]|uniref:glycoside hydrolase family 3 N-terminal domain-containing protein n=1 Tax=Demequina sp. TaxID=2050685 RepID=UPI003A8981C5
METVAYLDTSLPTEERVADLVSRMTLPEKVGQMMQLNAKDNVTAAIEDFHVGSILHVSPEAMLEADTAVRGSRLRIPLLVGEDCIHGHSFFEGAEIYPTQLGLAATWDRDLVKRVARATAVEVSTTGIHWTFSPVLCIARDLRWGRVSETFGEDPYLLGELASAMVAGYQGDGLDDPTAILATAKHFAGYSETQGGRDASEADLSRRQLRAWFLPPFERVAREGCRTFMLGYQAIDGTPITVNDWLLNDVLRGEWGYTGTLITDWDNVGNLVREQRMFPGYAEASAAAVNAGNDMIMTTPAFFQGAQDAVAQGLLDESRIDQAVARILTLKFDLGLFENSRLPDPERQRDVIAQPSHRELGLEASRRSLVLLENDGLLPLDITGASKRIVVVGPNAHDAQTQLGDWAGSSGQADWLMHGQPRDMILTVVDGLREQVPDGWDVAYHRGADIITTGPDPQGEFFPDGQPRPHIAFPVDPDPAQIAEAVQAAQGADAVVAVLGDRIELIGEGRSTATLELQGGQVALLDALIETGAPVVLVVLASKPHVLPASAQHASAIIWAANPGMHGGQALAELVLGTIEPTGRLPLSWPRHVGQQPVYYNQISAQHGYRYADLTQDPHWVFGEGRSYTTIEYSNLRLLPPSEEEVLRAEVTVTNTGSRPTLETVQVYLRDEVTSVTWADRELKAHAQVWVAPGESQVVPLALPLAACTIVNAAGERVIEPGEFTLLVGPSSKVDDLLPARFRIG